MVKFYWIIVKIYTNDSKSRVTVLSDFIQKWMETDSWKM